MEYSTRQISSSGKFSVHQKKFLKKIRDDIFFTSSILSGVTRVFSLPLPHPSQPTFIMFPPASICIALHWFQIRYRIIKKFFHKNFLIETKNIFYEKFFFLVRKNLEKNFFESDNAHWKNFLPIHGSVMNSTASASRCEWICFTNVPLRHSFGVPRVGSRFGDEGPFARAAT